MLTSKLGFFGHICGHSHARYRTPRSRLTIGLPWRLGRRWNRLCSGGMLGQLTSVYVVNSERNHSCSHYPSDQNLVNVPSWRNISRTIEVLTAVDMVKHRAKSKVNHVIKITTCCFHIATSRISETCESIRAFIACCIYRSHVGMQSCDCSTFFSASSCDFEDEG